MKETTKISKTFICSCGEQNKFEFETDFDINDVRVEAKCQNCGKEFTISLSNIFKRSTTTSLYQLAAPLESPVENTKSEEEVSQEEQAAFADLFGRL